jgi:hypothetical protein
MIALFLGVLALAVAASRAKKASGGFEAVVTSAGVVTLDKPPTLTMLRSSKPPGAVAPPQWWRLVGVDQSAPRSGKCGWGGDCNDVAVPPLFGDIAIDNFDRGGWLSVRMWVETVYAPAQKKSRPAAAYWSWTGPLARGARLSPVARAIDARGIAVANSGLPVADWLVATARIGVEGTLEIYFFYPGDEHTGKQRGRDYDIVVEWRVTEQRP